jgi:hypothetical protein
MGDAAGEGTAGVVGVGEAAVVDVGFAAKGSGGSSLSMVAMAVISPMIFEIDGLAHSGNHEAARVRSPQPFKSGNYSIFFQTY